MALGDRARDDREWDAAILLYRSALAHDLRNAPLWVQYGHALKQSGNLEDPPKLAKAEAAYRRALIYAPRVADTHLQLGHVLKLQRRISEAKAAYLLALALDPALAPARDELRALGCEEVEGTELKAALDSLEGVLAPRRLRPSLIERADAARDAGLWAAAVRYYRAALERAPDNAAIWVQYGHALKEVGNFKNPALLAEAETAYRRSLDFAQHIADTHLHLGHILKLQGKMEEAQAAYLRAFALDASLVDLAELRQLGWSPVEIGEIFDLLGRTTNADSTAAPVNEAALKNSDLLPAWVPVTDAAIACLKLPTIREETALFVTHSPLGRWKPHVPHYLNSLRRQGIAVILIVATDEALTVDHSDLMDAVDGLFVRQNQGYDFAGWAHVLRLHPELFGVKILYLLNDSIIGPTSDIAFAAMLRAIRSSSSGLIGLTDNYERNWHVQSYFLAFKQQSLRATAFKAFVERIVAYAAKQDVIDHLETTLTPALQDAGVNCEVLFPATDCSNPTILHWKELLESGFPFLKVETIRDAIPDVDTLNWRQLLNTQGYDVAVAERTLAQVRASVTATVGLAADSAPKVKGTHEVDDDPSIKLTVDVPEVVNGKAVKQIDGALQISGWALAREAVAGINVSIDGEVYGIAKYGMPRGDVARAYPDWKDSHLSGYAIVLGKGNRTGHHIVRIEVRTDSGRRKAVEFDIFFKGEQLAVGTLQRKMPLAQLALNESILSGLGCQPQFGIIMSVGGSDDQRALDTTLLSLRRQVYRRWQVAIIADGSTLPPSLAPRIASDFPDLADRIHLSVDRDEAFLEALTRSGDGRSPDLITVISAGDFLGCDALLQMAVSTGMNRDAEFFYSDERRISPISGKVEAFLKPGWSPDLLLSTNYIGRLWCARYDLVQQVGARIGNWRRFGEYDLVLRYTEAAQRVQHVPRVLCERGRPQIDPPVREQEALARALGRRMINGTLIAGCAPGYYRLKPDPDLRGLVSIIIPTRGARGFVRTCIATIRQITAYPEIEIIVVDDIPDTDPDAKAWLRTNADKVLPSDPPFNWSRYNNRASKVADGEFLLFLNDDIEVIDPDWLHSMVAHAKRPEVGIVGARLLYPNGEVQHAGMIWTPGARAARHSFRFATKYTPGYFGLAMTTRDVWMVTGACMMVRREWFEAIGGFDERHSMVNNDVDLCLRCWSEKKLVVYEPASALIHHDGQSRHGLPDAYAVGHFWKKWGRFLSGGDPYYNPNLSSETDHYAMESEPIQLFSSGYPLFSVEEVRRILVVKVDHIGDFISVIPAMSKLSCQFPQAELYLLTSPTNRPLAFLGPSIKEVIEFEFFFPRSELGKYRELTEDDLVKFERRLAPYHFDLAIDFRMHRQSRPLLQATGARWLAGYDRDNQFPWLDIAVEQESDDVLVRKRAQIGDEVCRLVDAVASATNQQRSFLRRPASDVSMGLVRRGRRLACVHPGCGTPTRVWPPGHFAALIDLLVSNHDLDVAMIGSPDEAETVAEVLNKVAHKEAVRSLVGKTSLEDLPAIIGSSVLFVGNNSGPNHIAAALGVPSVGIYSGVVDARQWGPKGPNAVAIQRQMHCSPCYLAKINDCVRNMACVMELYPTAVYRVCQSMLAIGSNFSSTSRDGQTPESDLNISSPVSG